MIARCGNNFGNTADDHVWAKEVDFVVRILHYHLFAVCRQPDQVRLPRLLPWPNVHPTREHNERNVIEWMGFGVDMMQRRKRGVLGPHRSEY